MVGRVITALVAAFLVLAAGGPAAGAPDSEFPAGQQASPAREPDEALRALLAQDGAVAAVRGRFLQTRRSPLLAEPLVSAGAFQLRAPGYARWVVENPEVLELEVDGDGIRAGRPGALREVPQRGPAGALRALLMLFLGTGAGSAVPFVVEPGEQPRTFRLHPEPGGPSGLERIDVRFAATGGPEFLELHESDGGVLEIRLMDVRVDRAPATGAGR